MKIRFELMDIRTGEIYEVISDAVTFFSNWGSNFDIVPLKISNITVLD